MPSHDFDPRLRSVSPFEPRYLDLEGDRLHFVDEGPRDPDAETLLFVHGNPTWSYHWRELIGALKTTHRCVAPDHLGCGLSDKPNRRFRLADRIDQLGQLIDTLELDNITLVAQDWGGSIGLGTMLSRHERLRRIVLFNTGAFPPPSIPRRIDICRMPLLGRLALQGANLFSRAAIRMTTSRRRLPRHIAQAYLAPYDSWRNRRAVYEFVADIPRNHRHPTWQTLVDIEQGLPSLAGLPILLVWGMQDWCFTSECLERFLRIWPEAQALRLEDAGHWVLEDAIEDALAAVRDFLDQTVTSESRSVEANT